MVGPATETQQKIVSCPYSTHPSCIDDWRLLVDSWPTDNIQVTWRRRPALKFKIKCPITGTKVCQLLVIVLSSKSGRVSTTQRTSTGVKAGYTGWLRIRVNHGLSPPSLAPFDLKGQAMVPHQSGVCFKKSVAQRKGLFPRQNCMFFGTSSA
jgi:hypothetical protein